MKTIKCLDCESNLLEAGLYDPRASLYLTDYDAKTNEFKKMHFVFNPFHGWNCGACDEEVLDEETFEKLQEYIIDLEDEKDVDKNLLDYNKEYYVDRICSRCEEKNGTEYADIIEDGIEIRVDVAIKFDKEANKFKIETVADATYRHINCGCCGAELRYSFDKEKLTSPVRIPCIL